MSNERTVAIQYQSEARSRFVAGTDYLKFTDDPDYIGVDHLLQLTLGDEKVQIKRLRVTKMRFANNQGVILEFLFQKDEMVLEIDPNHHGVLPMTLKRIWNGTAFLPRTRQTVPITTILDIALGYSPATGLLAVVTQGPDVIGITEGENRFIVDLDLMDYEPSVNTNGFLLEVDVVSSQP